MIKQALTDRKVKSLKRDTRREDTLGHYDVWDAVVPGLGVRTSATGRQDIHADGSLPRLARTRRGVRSALTAHSPLNKLGRRRVAGWN